MPKLDPNLIIPAQASGGKCLPRGFLPGVESSQSGFLRLEGDAGLCGDVAGTLQPPVSPRA